VRARGCVTEALLVVKRPPQSHSHSHLESVVQKFNNFLLWRWRWRWGILLFLTRNTNKYSTPLTLVIIVTFTVKVIVIFIFICGARFGISELRIEIRRLNLLLAG